MVPHRDGLIPKVASAQRGDRAGGSQFLPIHPEPSHAEPHPPDVIPCTKTFRDLLHPSEKSRGLIPTSLNVPRNAKWKFLCFLVEPRAQQPRGRGAEQACAVRFGGGKCVGEEAQTCGRFWGYPSPPALFPKQGDEVGRAHPQPRRCTGPGCCCCCLGKRRVFAATSPFGAVQSVVFWCSLP